MGSYTKEDRRVRVTAGFVPAPGPLCGTQESDIQVAAPAETRNAQLAPSKYAQRRVRMEGWRQIGGWLGSERENAKGLGRKPAISFIVDYMDHDHPSRLPDGSRRSTWTGPGRDPRNFLIRGNGRLCPGGAAAPPVGRHRTSCHREQMKFKP